MKVYPRDVLVWTVYAAGVALSTAAGAVLTSIVTGSLDFWSLVGGIAYCFLSWQAFRCITRRAYDQPDDAEMRRAWMELVRISGRYRDGTVLTTRDGHVWFCVHRKKMRAFERIRDSETDMPQVDAERGIEPVEFFVLGVFRRVLRFEHLRVLEIEDDEVVAVPQPLPGTQATSEARDDIRRLADQARLYEATREQLRELVVELREASPETEPE